MGTPVYAAEQMMRRTLGNKPSLYIGIDPGTNTGFAVWNPITRKFLRVESMLAVKAEQTVLLYHQDLVANGKSIHVVVEDTRKLRLPKSMQSQGRERGAGSVARDMARWSEYLEYYNIPHTMAGLCPKDFRNGSSDWFKEKTGWDKRTNEHARCAAGMAWGR